MKTGMLLAIGFAMCLLPTVSFAQQSAPAAPAKAPVEMDQLKPFVGVPTLCTLRCLVAKPDSTTNDRGSKA